MSESDYWSEDTGDQGTWVGGGDSGGYWEPTAPALPVATPAAAPASAPAADINSLYQEMLGRAPDPTGIAANAGASAEEIRQSILSSPEYAARTGATDDVTALYRDLLGRDPDPTGIAANAGASAEAIRQGILSSPEYASLNQGQVSAPTAFTPYNLDQYGYTTDQETQYYNSAKLANWQMERGRPDLAQQYIEEANALKKQLDSPYRIDTITAGGGGDAGSGTSTSYLVDRSGSIISAVAPQEGGKYNVNFEGAGDSGTSSSSPVFTLDDLLKQAVSEKNTPFGLGRGQAAGYAYELKNEEGEPFQRYDANGNLTEFVNRLTGEWTKASDVKPIGSAFDPMQGKFVTEYQYGDNKFIATPGSAGSTFAPVMDPYSKDTGGFMGEGGWARAGALVAAGLTAGLASGALVPAAMVGAAPGSAAAIGLTAAKGALTSIAVSGIQGATPAEMLKAGVLGGVGAGLGGFVGAADLGTVGNIAAKAGIQTGLTALAGGNVPNALISSLINSTLPVVLGEVLPPETASIIADLPKPIQTIIMSTAGNVIGAGFNGQDISSAAVNGVTNGLISLGKDLANGAFKDLSESELVQTVKDYLTPKTTAGGFLGEYGDMAPAPEQRDVVNSIFEQDAEDVMMRNAPPLVRAAIDQNTNKDDVFNTLVAGMENPYVGTPSSPLASATTSDVDPLEVTPNRFSASGPVSVSWNEPEAADDQSSTAGGFLGEYGDLAPAQSKLATFGQGVASALDNTVGAVLPTVAQMASYLGLRTFDQIAELTNSMLGKEYAANPEMMREISNRVAESISNPFGKAFGVTDTPGYKGEASGQLLRFVSENIDKGADYLSEKTGLPAGDIRLITDTMLMRPGQTAALAREGITAAKDVGRGYVDAATGIVSDSPTGAYNLGATVADLTRAPDGSLIRGESSTRPINLGEIIDEAPSYVSPERLSAPAPALGYSPTEAITSPRDVASFFDDAFAAADRIPTYDVSPLPKTESTATQLAPEARGSLPTTFAEPAIKPIDLGLSLDSGSLARINTEASLVDRNLSNLDSPQVQAQTKAFVQNTYTAVAKEAPSAFTTKFYDDLYFNGADSSDVATAIASTVNNKSADPETIIKQVDDTVAPLEEDQQLAAKLELINNANQLGITPYEAIELGLVNNNGTKTELGEKVMPSVKPQPQPQPQPEPIPPLKPVKPIKPVFPPPIINPPPPSINPPAIINPPPTEPPIEETPPIDIIPSIEAPPLVADAIAKASAPKVPMPTASLTPSYMFGIGAQGASPGALPGNLEATFLQGANVNEYNPFENYNVYQQLQPVRAAQGGSPLQLAQLQQGVYGIDPSLYSVLQKRPTPNYFTYGEDTSGGSPTKFAGSQLQTKPTPGIPVIPTGQASSSDWLYKGSGSNPLSMAGSGISNLPSGTMAEGGQAHGGEDEHIPEFITGATGHYVKGRGDGQSDDIPAMLADGEYVFDAETVAQLGNGSSDAGARVLDKMREAIRGHKRSAPLDEIPPKSKSPLEYLAEATKGKRK
jgi:hypothetical protein